MTHTTSVNPLKIGISSCLLGEKVRYDGEHKKNQFIVDTLSPLFELVPYCPEVAIGMGIPRPPIQLVDCHGEVHALGIADPGMDVSLALRQYGKKIAIEITDLSGYIFKRNSPSCGTSNVKVLVDENKYELRGQGLFASEIMQHLPRLPVIDELQFMNEARRLQFLNEVSEYGMTHHQ